MKYCNYINENHEFRLSVFQQVLPHIEMIVNYENHYAYSFCHRIFATWIYLWFLSYTVLSLWFTFMAIRIMIYVQIQQIFILFILLEFFSNLFEITCRELPNAFLQSWIFYKQEWINIRQIGKLQTDLRQR